MSHKSNEGKSNLTGTFKRVLTLVKEDKGKSGEDGPGAA